MRFNGKRILKGTIDGAVEFHSETREAVCYDVIPAQRVARVKVQGSSRLIVAEYPQSWQVTPSWLKPGAPVVIRHTGGLRQRSELIGPGNYLPTPVEDDPGPGSATPDDAVISGCQVLAASTPSLTMTITAGTYRIGGQIYSYAGGTQAISAGSGTPGYFRIDIIAIDATRTLYPIPGTPSANPGASVVPDGQVELGRILVAPGATSVSQGFVNRAWMARVATSFLLTPAETELNWETDTDIVTFLVTDQYGIALSGSWNFTAQIIQGDGQIGGTAAPDVYSGNFSGSSTTLTYTRSELTTECSPVIQGVLTPPAGPTILGATFIKLLNENGDPAFGGPTSSINTLTSASSITVDWSKYKTQKVVASDDIDFTFIGGSDGDKLLLIITQDGTGGWIPTFPENIGFGSDMTEFDIDANPDKRTYCGFIYNWDEDQYDLVAISKGFTENGS